uniref:ATP synthase F0 subunit 8 n=1 Tax=Aporrectodea trapezoides TaxID=408844 RepID=UPI0021CC8A8E|nr:ATP synthase F0 subunit 8 [Aporrectodea trapezoides]UWM94556.1 ATP synthase F0 subunit 8 [Aporrectodea trapezoides]
MPHLSPMAWIISIVLFWATISLMASTFWWSEHHMFNSTSTHTTPSLKTTWKWS